jgi:uncharacterized 2Fe-2S/4Fe-4S cluster protein (DUF4445 family)
MTLPFKDAAGNDAPRRVIIKDPSVSVMLVAERLQGEVEKAKAVKDIAAMRESLKEQVYELLRIDNEVTVADIATLPFGVLVKVSTYVTDHIKGVFLEGSPKPSTSVSSESKTDEKASQNESITPSSALAS